MFQLPPSEGVVALALAEDLGVPVERLTDPALRDISLLERDVTSSSVVGLDARFTGRIVARERCVVCGLPLVELVFSVLSDAADLFDPVEVFPLVAEGSVVEPGTAVAEVEGMAAAVLAGERTALDLLMILSGMSTVTRAWVDAARGAFDVCDTRKTLPGLRALSKYAVRVGGGTNHREGLHDMVLIKDNHLARAGSVARAVKDARTAHPGLIVEVEADTPEQAYEAVTAGAHLILLDNMDDELMRSVTTRCRELATTNGSTVLIEASGGIDRSRLAGLRSVGVDRVSSSELTLAPPVDFGFDES